MPFLCKEKITPDSELIFIIISGSGKILLQDCNELHTYLHSFINDNKQLKLLIDLTKVDNISMDIVKPLAQNMTNMETVSKDKVLGTAIVVSNKLINKFINLVFSLKTPSTPTTVTSNIQEACEYLNSF